MTSVFLSYARADDEAFVARAYASLRERGFVVWWDRRNMPARALAFTEEIREAIHNSDRVVVVIGPQALRSDYVRAEWQAALSERKPVVTALRLVPEGAADPHSCLPPELKVFHAEPFLAVDGKEPSLDPLERLLSDPLPSPPRIFGRSPERPPHFRPRPDVFSDIFDAVLGETTKPEVHTHERRVTVLTGMGGIGKTVLAATLVEAMRSRPTKFLEDGIYWLSGDPLRRLAALCLTASADPRDEDSLIEAVAQQLDGKRFLLVVDNATDVRQLAWLARVLGAGGRMLVTTRHGELAVGHRHIDVDRLAEDDALSLVADWLRVPVEQVPAQARLVVKLCGFHPFAIALNAAAASQGLAWSAIITALERRELDFAEHRFEEYVYATVDQSIQVSLDALSERDRARYLEFAAFFWEGGVPTKAILDFWQRRAELPEHRGLRLLVFFQQRSLLQLQGPIERQDVRLHDLHGSYLGRDARNVAALGDALLASYEQELQQPGAWWSMPDDGYLRRHVVRHLIRSRSAGDALAVISAENDERRNAWYDARVHGSGGGEDGFAGYVADLVAVSTHADNCLLVFIAASLRSLARAVPGALLRAAIGDERWSINRAIARARLIAEPEKRARAIMALLSQSMDRDALLDETLWAIEKSEVTLRGNLLRALAPLLQEPELLPVLRRLVSWVERAATPFEETSTRPLLHNVLKRIPAPLAGEALRIADTVGFQPTYLYGLLPEPERTARIRTALDERREGPDGLDLGVVQHAYVVGALARHLDPGTAAKLTAESLAEVRALGPGWARYRGLLDLLPILGHDEQPQVLDELVERAREHKNELHEVVASAPPEHHGRIRKILEALGLPWLASEGLALSGEHRKAAVERALELIEARDNAASLLWMDDAQLILAMNDSQLERAGRVIETQLRGESRVRALIAVARASSAERRMGMLDHVLSAIEGLPEADDRERAYADVAPLLSTAHMSKALSAAEHIGEPSGISQVLKMLPHLSGAARAPAVELVLRHAEATRSTDWVEALRATPPGADIEALHPMLEYALALDPERGKPQLLAALATRVGERERTRAMNEARAAIANDKSVRLRIRLLLELGDTSAAEWELSQVAHGLDADDLTQVVAQIAPRLAPDRSAHWVQLALNRRSAGKHVLETLAPVLDAAKALSYLAACIVPDDPMDRIPLLKARALDEPLVTVEEPAPTAAALAERIAMQGAADAAWELVRLGRDNEVTAMALVALAPWLSRERLLDVERRVLSASIGMIMVPTGLVRHSASRNYLTARLAPSLARAGQVQRALDYAAQAGDVWRIATCLGIAEATDGPARSSTLLVALRALLAQRDVFRKDGIDDVARAIARDRDAAQRAWAEVTAWARSRPRNEAVEVLAALAPVAAAAGGEALVDEVFAAIEDVVRWWP